MREGTYPTDECLSTASNPKAESWVLCAGMLLWVLQFSTLWVSASSGTPLPAGCW